MPTKLWDRISIFVALMIQKKGGSRIIMEHKGRSSGPLLVVISAIHGNEQAGIKALELVSKMLEVEPITNPSFSFNGRIVGMIGNMAAVSAAVRFIDQDLNRMWHIDFVSKLKSDTDKKLTHEEKELKELLALILGYASEGYSEVCLLDLHTTSSDGGIFTIPCNDQRSLEIAQKLHAPVILDMLEGISGTTLHYFNQDHFKMPPITSLTFEAGQHNDPYSINRCIAAIVNCLRSLGCVKQEDVENIHDSILISYAQDLPALSRLKYKHEIKKGDDFAMNPGYRNFDPVDKDEELATDKDGPIFCKSDGLILMPLYQDQGEEGFYIIDPVSI